MKLFLLHVLLRSGTFEVSRKLISRVRRYCQQLLNETVRTAKLTPVAARLQELEGKVDQHVIPKEVPAPAPELCWSSLACQDTWDRI